MKVFERSTGESRRWPWLAVITLACALVSPTLAGEHKLSTIPPSMELEVLDPRADPLGRPTVELNPDCEGGLVVDIPRTVIVHKLYYTGDRSFQAQLLPGGPSVLVVNHPRTGERCYIDVTLPPGAPRIHYTGSTIEYDFGEHGVLLHFPRIGRPKVTFRNGVPLRRKATAVTHAATAGVVHVIGATTVPEHVGEIAQGATAVVINTASYAEGFGERLVAPIVAVARMTPLGSLAKRDPAKEAECARKLAERKRKHHQEPLEETIPTVR